MRKILVLGNCQARPMSDVMARTGQLNVLPSIILHLAKAEECHAHEELLDQADVIMAQLTAPTFEPSHLRSAALKKKYGDKVIIWPNMFFVGQQPFLRYLTHAQAGRILGPMDAYHDLRTLRYWFASRKGVDFAPYIEVPDYAAQVAQRSLGELQQREAQCDVPVVDLIADNMAQTPLFFTFNHPTSWLLTRFGARCRDTMGLASSDPSMENEPLGRFRPPSLQNAAGPFQGVEINLSQPGTIQVGPVRPYDPSNLQEASLAAYDHVADLMEPELLRATPAY